MRPYETVYTTAHEVHSTSELNHVIIVYKSYGIKENDQTLLPETKYDYQNANYNVLLLSCQPKVTLTYNLLTIAKYNNIVYSSLELTRIERSLVY